MERTTMIVGETALYKNLNGRYSPCRNCELPRQPDEDCKAEKCSYADALDKLAAYEDAEESGLLVRLPCKVGDGMYSFLWNIQSEEYEVYSSKIKNVRYDSCDGSITVSDGERLIVWGKNAFSTREAAEAALTADDRKSRTSGEGKGHE